MAQTLLLTKKMLDSIKITIDSDLMRHPGAPGDGTGYEAIFHDTGSRGFAARSLISDWDGKNDACNDTAMTTPETRASRHSSADRQSIMRRGLLKYYFSI